MKYLAKLRKWFARNLEREVKYKTLLKSYEEV
jgi:hypothetical protein